jgi:hypothetical protein
MGSAMPTFNAQHYEAIAKVFAKHRPVIPSTAMEPLLYWQWSQLKDALSAEFEIDNPDFDPAIFSQACDPE